MALFDLLDFTGRVLDKVLPDSAARAAAQERLLALQQKGELAELDAETKLLLGQMEVNKAEAINSSLFVSGGRPAVIWICAFAMGYQTIIYPFLQFVAILAGYSGLPFPTLDHELMTYGLLPALLGVAGMRSFDKRSRRVSK